MFYSGFKLKTHQISDGFFDQAKPGEKKRRNGNAEKTPINSIFQT